MKCKTGFRDFLYHSKIKVNLGYCECNVKLVLKFFDIQKDKLTGDIVI